MHTEAFLDRIQKTLSYRPGNDPPSEERGLAYIVTATFRRADSLPAGAGRYECLDFYDTYEVFGVEDDRAAAYARAQARLQEFIEQGAYTAALSIATEGTDLA